MLLEQGNSTTEGKCLKLRLILVVKENYRCEVEKEERSNTTFDSKIKYYILLPLAKLPDLTEVSWFYTKQDEPLKSHLKKHISITD